MDHGLGAFQSASDLAAGRRYWEEALMGNRFDVAVAAGTLASGSADTVRFAHR
jgi:hypothetical protein